MDKNGVCGKSEGILRPLICPAGDRCRGVPDYWSAFGELGSAVKSELASGWRANRYSRGNILFYQGNEPLGLFFLCEGRVKLVRSEDGGRNHIFRIINAPDLLGDRSLIARKSYAATAEVMEEARICFVDSARFLKLWDRHPEVPRFLARRLAVKLGEAEDLATDIALRTVRERVAKLIAIRAESAVPSASFRLDLSRQEIAELIGASPEVVSRTLAVLAARKLISFEGRRVRILDSARLRAAARISAQPHDAYQAKDYPKS